MEKIKQVANEMEAIKLLTIALEHEWAVSLEYIIHAYSMPKGRFFYLDPVMGISMDIRAQTIQIGLDEMYHALQLGLTLRQMGVVPSFKTNEIVRYPLIRDNLRRDKMTEDLVAELYQSVVFLTDDFPFLENMVRNIAGDEVRHSRQFQTMIDSLAALGANQVPVFRSSPEAEEKSEVKLLHEIMRQENDLMHRYLFYMLLFSHHQDLSQRLFKNSIDHMRHWDKNSGLLIKMGSVVRIEGAVMGQDGEERSVSPMPSSYPEVGRHQALESLLKEEKDIVDKYERILTLVPGGEIKDQLSFHLAQNREHLFTQEWLLKNTRQN